MVNLAVRNQLTGKTLRWVVCLVLRDARRAMTVAEIVREVERLGYEVPGARPGKTVSDALRWEVRRGRVVLVKRGLYMTGLMQRSTEWSMRRRVKDLKSAAPKSLVAASAALAGADASDATAIPWSTPAEAAVGTLLAEAELSLVADAAPPDIVAFDVEAFVTAADDAANAIQ